jgi:hypothetical protein
MVCIDSKIVTVFNHILVRFPNCDNQELVDLKVFKVNVQGLFVQISMMELMLSLVEGQFPQKETETSGNAIKLLALIDFNAIVSSF